MECEKCIWQRETQGHCKQVFCQRRHQRREPFHPDPSMQPIKCPFCSPAVEGYEGDLIACPSRWWRRCGGGEGEVYQSTAFQVPASICRATVLSGDCGNGGRVQMLAAVHFIVGFFFMSFAFVFDLIFFSQHQVLLLWGHCFIWIIVYLHFSPKAGVTAVLLSFSTELLWLACTFASNGIWLPVDLHQHSHFCVVG